jgi:8-oxo-dGTP pyrophosphatase MutT (NUDIX family)
VTASNPNLLFQYIQKLVVLSADRQSVLVAKRKGEADYDGTFSFIGGKMETTDESLIAGMKREKDEEIGPAAVIKVLPNETYNVLFRKSSGQMTVNPHTPAVFVSGEISINPEEYSEYRWVSLSELDQLEPKIQNIPMITRWAADKLDRANPQELVQI